MSGPSTRIAPEQRPILHVEDDRGGQRLVKRAVGKLAELELVATMAEAVASLRAERRWLAFIFDLGLPDGSGWDLVTVARELHPTTPVLVFTCAWTRTNYYRTLAERVRYLDKLCPPPEELRAFIADIPTHHSTVRERIHSLVVRKTVQYGFTPTEAVIVESELCGQPRGQYLDGRVVSLSSVRDHVANVLTKVRERGSPVETWDELRRTLLRELAGAE